MFFANLSQNLAIASTSELLCTEFTKCLTRGLGHNYKIHVLLIKFLNTSDFQIVCNSFMKLFKKLTPIYLFM